MASEAEIDATFNAAVLRMTQAEASKRHEAVVHQHAMQLYGLLQQATKGDNDTDRPRCPINNTGKAKWYTVSLATRRALMPAGRDAWTARSGMASEAAKQEYTRLVASILPPTDSSAQVRCRVTIIYRSSRSDKPQETTARGLQLKRWTPSQEQAQQTIFLHLLVYVGVAMFAIHVVVVLAQHINAVCAVNDSVLCAAWHQSYWLRLGGSWISVGLAVGTLLQTHVVQLLSVL
ncbi:hypothetical protein SPRG_11896 [Saprolegnia parasitica CBS 223.65]|uniref:ACB domain-containing protein n=1 Tax=Saprolegnia parasitica (strain CBS 223.65) TaxID=695850 RepID=A0A067BWZ2_SAPPC|nr:hypothetical protein SPRG_11896 [Saprolegnia parasitica CBS 223.65]KDO23049.1 hypothetical protein SPRG_11896 [Saprolegnia parasitica CBS 223.65]|eukprot:XP_012206166.1 hypothetical protein SPRG_11896 [Saprolegnia parasitica CBS 223.65]